MQLTQILFFVAALTITGLSGVYIGRRLIAPLPLAEKVRRWGRRVMVALCVFPFLAVGLNFLVPSDVTLPLIWIAMLSFAFCSWLLAVSLIVDLTRLVRFAALRKKPVDESRRRLIQTAVSATAFGGSSVLLGVGTREAMHGPEIVSVEIPIVDLPPAFDGFSIAQISDLHVGLTIRRQYVESVLARASDLGADAIAVTGDLVDGSVADLRRHLEPLKELRARSGVYFVTGNHEYISGVDAWLDEVARYGMTPLLNEHRIITRGDAQLVMAGIVDRSAGRFGSPHREDPVRAFVGAPANAKRIMLAHQPVQVEKVAAAGADLQLSGHTHGGQYFPWNYAIHLVQPYVAGLSRFEKTWIYVNRGTGYWGPPVRLGPTSEITKIVLRRA